MDDVNKFASTEDKVREYLLNNSNFFIDNPDLLVQMNFPHSTPGAVSIIERQVSLLREHHAKLRERMSELVYTARNNAQLLEKIQALTVALLQQKTPAQMIEVLHRSLLDEFGLDHVLLVLPDTISRDVLPQTRYLGSEQFTKMSNAIYNVKVFLGRTPGKIKQHLLDGGNPRAKSVALIRLHIHHEAGYLLIGSSDEGRFRSDMGSDFTSYIGTLVSAMLEQLLPQK